MEYEERLRIVSCETKPNHELSRFLTSPDHPGLYLLLNERSKRGGYPGRGLSCGVSQEGTNDSGVADGPADNIRCLLAEPLQGSLVLVSEGVGANEE